MKRGPYKNRKALFEKAVELRKQSFGLRTIRNLLDEEVSERTLRRWLKDIQINRSVAFEIAMRRRLENSKPISKSAIRNKMIRERGHRCERFKNTEWLGKPIPLEVDHIDGDKTNNTENNRRLLCANCHAQTPSWRRKKSGIRA